MCRLSRGARSRVAPGLSRSRQGPACGGAGRDALADGGLTQPAVWTGARDAATGRFLNRDAIGYAGGLNFYRYAGNGPSSSCDPDGLISRWGAGLAGGAAGPLAGPEGIPEGVLAGLALYDGAHDLGTATGSP